MPIIFLRNQYAHIMCFIEKVISITDQAKKEIKEKKVVQSLNIYIRCLYEPQQLILCALLLDLPTQP